MMAMNVEAEIRELQRRVGELEGTFGFLTNQIKTVHKDLLAFEARTEQRLEKVEGRLDKIEVRLEKVEGKLDLVDASINGLRKDLPEIVASTMREVLREQKAQSRKS